jgi:hypothetical protein
VNFIFRDKIILLTFFLRKSGSGGEAVVCKKIFLDGPEYLNDHEAKGIRKLRAASGMVYKEISGF